MDKLPDHIKTPAGESEFRIKEKGSAFISLAKPAWNENDAVLFLNSIKKKFYGATHHCYSYKLADGTFKYSDDGEPNGTAGIRIYNAQNHFDLTNLITIVVRYFGGVKLGVGPLGKAYYEAALGVLNSSTIEEMILHHEITLTYNFDQSKTLHHLVAKHSLIIRENIFEEHPRMICLVPAGNESNFFSDISTLTTKIGAIRAENPEYIPAKHASISRGNS